MDPTTVSVTVGRPQEEVFAYLADLANHPEFTDHFLVDWHLTRVESYGRGAGARFRVRAPGARFGWADQALVEVEPPRRLVAIGRGGKDNRVRLAITYELAPGGAGTTRVAVTIETEPGGIVDRLAEALGQRAWLRRKTRRALRRLRAILEEDRDRGRRATVAAR